MTSKSWSTISLEVKRLNVKVTGSNKCNVENVAATNKHSPEDTSMNAILQVHNTHLFEVKYQGRRKFALF